MRVLKVSKTYIQLSSPSTKMFDGVKPYSLQKGTHSALQGLFQAAHGLVVPEVKKYLQDVTFDSIGYADDIGLPCLLKETEAVTALKAFEARTVAAIADLRFGMDRDTSKSALSQPLVFFRCISFHS